MARTLVGEVIGTHSDKTAVVAVTRLKNHPLYGKKYRVTRKYLVHDPQNKAQVGGRVEITASRPISRHKRWVLKGSVSTPKGES